MGVSSFVVLLQPLVERFWQEMLLRFVDLRLRFELTKLVVVAVPFERLVTYFAYQLEPLPVGKDQLEIALASIASFLLLWASCVD